MRAPAASSIDRASGKKSPGHFNALLVSGGKLWSVLRNKGKSKAAKRLFRLVSGPFLARFGGGLGLGVGVGLGLRPYLDPTRKCFPALNKEQSDP